MARPLRKDALERRRALLRAAAVVLAEQGLDAPLDAVAERAGVGRATLYRNFANRTELALAVLGQEVEDLAERAAARGDDPDGLFDFFADMAELLVRNAGFASALRLMAPEAMEPLRARLVEAGTGPLRRAQASGRVRADLEPQDLTLVSNMLGGGLAGNPAERRAASRRAFELVTTGLRPRP